MQAKFILPENRQNYFKKERIKIVENFLFGQPSMPRGKSKLPVSYCRWV